MANANEGLFRTFLRKSAVQYIVGILLQVLCKGQQTRLEDKPPVI